MKQFILIFLVLLTSTFCFQTAWAQKAYVSDVLYVPLRSGKGGEFRIIENAVKSGTALEILEEDKESGWFKVRTSNGNEGYMRGQYIVREPTSGLKLAEANKDIASLNNRVQQLQNHVDQLQSENQDLNTELNTSKDAKSQTTRELEEIKRISSDAIELSKRHQALLNQHQMLQTQVDILKAENDRFKNDNRHTWFIYGAAAVLLGVIIALIIPIFGGRRKNSEWMEYK